MAKQNLTNEQLNILTQKVLRDVRSTIEVKIKDYKASDLFAKRRKDFEDGPIGTSIKELQLIYAQMELLRIKEDKTKDFIKTELGESSIYYHIDEFKLDRCFAKSCKDLNINLLIGNMETDIKESFIINGIDNAKELMESLTKECLSKLVFNQ